VDGRVEPGHDDKGTNGLKLKGKIYTWPDAHAQTEGLSRPASALPRVTLDSRLRGNDGKMGSSDHPVLPDAISPVQTSASNSDDSIWTESALGSWARA
jgi:hypothetical protein